jgi:hypothetical protein
MWIVAMADSLRTVIGTTLAIGGVLIGILLVRGTRFAPEWLSPTAPGPSTSTGLEGTPELPPGSSLPPPPAAATEAPPPAPTASTAVSPSSTDSIASATPEPSASALQPVASASAGKARKPGAPSAGQPAEPPVAELPEDYRYSPQGAGNLTFPVSPPTASTAGHP